MSEKCKTDIDMIQYQKNCRNYNERVSDNQEDEGVFIIVIFQMKY